MCGAPKMETPTVRRMASPQSNSIVREGELERMLRRSRSGVAADVLTSPLGLPGAAQ